MARAALSEAATEYRRAMWALGILGLAGIVLSWMALRGMVPRVLGLFGLPVGLAGVALAAWFGIRARQRALQDQALVARRSMLVMLAAQLGHQDDATLARIAQQGGPAGEAATMILQGRRSRSQPG